MLGTVLNVVLVGVSVVAILLMPRINRIENEDERKSSKRALWAVFLCIALLVVLYHTVKLVALLVR